MSYPVGTPHRRRGTRSIGATRRGLARRSSTALRQACPWQVEHLSHPPAFAVPDRGEHRHVRARRPCLSVRLCGVRSDRRRCVGDGGISPIRASSYISRGLAGPPSNRPVGAAALRRRPPHRELSFTGREERRFMHGTGRRGTRAALFVSFRLFIRLAHRLRGASDRSSCGGLEGEVQQWWLHAAVPVG